ncbi:hypothetical protein Cgig2_021179 [Carnegiea gigantea]|uniref:5'-nucleotidase domain-containing protein 4 n=1 Tax=Carnegiea gigantea TaxID=171969 RepID=A0A9Q1KY59_9CARY|nr:hypothetical protein Cgig2_021179 [Carnegiea gigantea]
MRIPKRNVLLCFSYLRPQFSFPLAFLSNSSLRLTRFSSGFPPSSCALSSSSSSPTKRCQIFAGTNKLHKGLMDGTADEPKMAGQMPCVWSSPSGGENFPLGKRIFCNRSLNMKSIVAVGFDMDYTLAQYKPETFESLAYDGTIRKLVLDLGYPPELLEWTFDWTYMVRGLVLDKKRGNILKMDRHKYVKVAYHGFREMSKEEKVETYGYTLTRDSFDEPDYALIDTLFSLAEAYLFAQLVDFTDKNPVKVPAGADYARMYKDVRAAVDLCHRDGTLKQMVAKDPQRGKATTFRPSTPGLVARYINDDTSIVPMLEMLRDSGRSTFLVTNSLWDYTNIVMNFLCRRRTANVNTALSFEWLKYFDVVITGSAKPGFFHEDNRANLFEVVPDSGMLVNTDNGTPMPQVGSTVPHIPSKGLGNGCRVFQGGNVAHLHKLLNIGSSSQVLYVGDHIYGDILRSKKVLGWRTMLVVPELEREVELLWELRDTRKIHLGSGPSQKNPNNQEYASNQSQLSRNMQLQGLRCEREHIEDRLQHIKWSLKFEDLTSEQKEKLCAELDNLEGGGREEKRKKGDPIPEGSNEAGEADATISSTFIEVLHSERERVRLGHQQLLYECHRKFHKIWGQLMKTGYQNSRFAHQVERFACLYTSQVTNLSLYSPDKYYRPSEDFMPHEFGILCEAHDKFKYGLRHKSIAE